MTTAASRIKLVVAVLLGAAAVVPAASASPASLQHATSHCWLQVINDWLDNSRVDGTYAIPCYTQAIQKLQSYSDISGYSNAIEDIRSAELAAIRQDRSNSGPAGSSGGSNTPTGGPPSGGPPGSGPSNPTGPSGTSSGGQPKLLGIPGPSSATSIPLPLIVLGALAVLLALAALAAWVARRYQSRRPSPPAPAPVVSRRR
jgi:hypothetical protein